MKRYRTAPNANVLVFAAVLLFSLVLPAFPAFVGGEQIADDCKRNASVMYVVGVADGLVLNKSYRHCMPPTLTGAQLDAVVCKWLHEHPEKWHFTASSLIRRAISDAFPC